MGDGSTRGFARLLRKQETAAEAKLWGHLRKRSLDGFRFTRQTVVGPFIVDFLCRERGLAIEVDGATHGDEAVVMRDMRRTAFLNAQGVAVHRVNNADVYENIGGVLETILLILAQRPQRFVRTQARTPFGLRPPPPAKPGEGI